MKIICPNCLKEIDDLGKDATCDLCFCSPIPSYAYPEGHYLHPASSGCVVREPGAIPFRKRITALPKLDLSREVKGHD